MSTMTPAPQERSRLPLAYRGDSASTDNVDLSLEITEFSSHDQYYSFDRLPPFPVPWRHPLKCLSWTVSLLFGFASLIVFLAVLAAIPVLNVLAFGYLLEAQGRVARTGRLTYAFPLLPLTPRLGSIALGVWLWLLVVRLVADAANDARIIAPGSPAAIGWNVFLTIVSVGVAAHLVLSIARGGGFWCFFRPLKNVFWLMAALRRGDYFPRAEAAVREFVVALRIPHHFWLGLRGYIGTFLWLAPPTAIFAALQDTSKPGQVLLTLLGGVLLIPVLCWVPLLQANFAAENRLGAFLQVRKIRELYRRASIRCFLAIIVTYGLALPMYLFKIAAPPRDALWFETMIFIATIYPAKIFVGWSYARAQRCEARQWFFLRWPLWIILAAALAFYLFLLFFTPAIGAAGRRVLFDHHALLLPTPF
ncbi:MAG TPA: hypothetical protein VFG20_18745 [Planctomycetaceae bacterium]|nr:hypothetical protein [Planctomycetaceae bacterium]